MSLLDGKPHIVTETNCKARWSGGANGIYLRCSLCGHKFVPGDVMRFVITNTRACCDAGVPGGNPKVCAACDGTNEEIYAKWKTMHEEWTKIEVRFWEFIRQAEARGGQDAMNDMARNEKSEF